MSKLFCLYFVGSASQASRGGGHEKKIRCRTDKVIFTTQFLDKRYNYGKVILIRNLQSISSVRTCNFMFTFSVNYSFEALFNDFRPTDPHSGVQDLAGGPPSLFSGVQKQTTLVSKVVGALADRLALFCQIAQSTLKKSIK